MQPYEKVPINLLVEVGRFVGVGREDFCSVCPKINSGVFLVCNSEMGGRFVGPYLRRKEVPEANLLIFFVVVRLTMIMSM